MWKRNSITKVITRDAGEFASSSSVKRTKRNNVETPKRFQTTPCEGN